MSVAAKRAANPAANPSTGHSAGGAAGVAAPPSARAPVQRRLAVAAALVASVLALYAPVRHYPFVQLDDNDYVTENPAVRTGLSADNVHWALTAYHSGHWHPLTWLSLMLDCHWSGADPGALHAGNALLHAAGVAVFFLALEAATGSLAASAFAAALFALHPLRVESVAWIAARKDVLSGLFVMLTLWAWTLHAKSPSPLRYGLALAAFATGMTAKPTLAVIPCGLLLLDAWPLGRIAMPGGAAGTAPAFTVRRAAFLVAEKVPFLAVALLTLTQTWAAQKAAGAVASEELSLATRAGNALWHYALYAGRTLWPFDLAVFYPLRNASPAEAAAAGAGLLAATLLAWRQRHERPWLLVGWLWFAGMVLPVSGLVQFGGQSMADRYAYLPHLGLAVAVAWTLAGLADRARLPRPAAAAAALALLAALAARSADQLGYWKDSVTLLGHAIDVTEGNYMAHNNLGTALEAAGDLPGASRHYEEAARLNPTWPEARNNVGIAHAWRGDLRGAIAHFEAALQVRPRFAKAENNMGTALAQLGDLDAAIGHYERAVEIDPAYFDARYALADALERHGRAAEAAVEYARLLELKPGWPPATAGLSRCRAATGG